MLLNSMNSGVKDFDATYGSIHNYHERMVMDAIRQNPKTRALSANLQADVACIALNTLPPKYVRYDVDMAFYMSSAKHIEMLQSVDAAVADALSYIELRQRVVHAEDIAATV